MSKEKNSGIMKKLFLGNEFDVDLTGLDFKSLGFSLSDINIEENEAKNGNFSTEKDDNAVEEPLSDLSDDNPEQFIKGNKDENNEKPKPISTMKIPLTVNKKKMLMKIKDNNLNSSTISQPTNNVTNNKFNVEVNNSFRNNVTKLKSNESKYSQQSKDVSNQCHVAKLEINKEKDMNLELVCVHNGEKIYKLSDLFVPLNESVIRRVEKYISKTMNNTEKEIKTEAPGETSVKKDFNETIELKQMIKKSKRNQRFQKLNFTYNEKYFDKTCFSDNININNTLADSLFKSKVNEEIDECRNNSFVNMNKENFILNPNNCSDHLKQVVENNLLNSLFFIKMKLNQTKNCDESRIFCEENESDDIKTEKKTRGFNLFDSTFNAYDKLYEEEEVANFNETFLKGNKEIPEIDSSKIVSNSNLEYIESINKKNEVDVKESSILQKNLQEGAKSEGLKIGYQDNFKKSFTMNDKEMSIISGIENIKDKEHLFKHLNIPSEIDSKHKSQSAKESLLFNIVKSEDYTEKEVLFDKFKRKRYRQNGYLNLSFKNGDFKNCVLIDANSTTFQNFKNISKRVYDTNDYNMNLEQIKINPNNKKEGTAPEDFLSSLGKYNQSLVTNSNNTLKIGKSKTNILTHAKCAYNLNYYRLNLSSDDIKEFHRPNICRYFLKEKKKKNFSFTISENFDISNAENTKSWAVTILTRNYLKKREKKRISKNIQYMNSYEIFKDRFKLSLVEGKFVLVEHIDEYPIFLSNFGMASKLKKYIYSNKLFNSSSSNPNVKHSDAEHKTKNIIGPFGAQILLQTNKNPLLGHIDQNELKGITVLDNNMFRAPSFYEKITNTTNKNTNKEKKYMNFLITFKKGKEGKEGVFIRELEHLYVIGQEEPKIEVYPPQSKQYNNFLKKKIQTYTYKLYNEIGFNAGINFKVFTNLFPSVTEQILKKNFREMKIEIDKNICYYTKIPTEDNNMQITPENICQYETSQFGLFKLRDMGIKTLTNPEKISYSTNKFIQQIKNPEEQFLARVIEAELLSTPWNITQNFLNAKQTKGMLSIKGTGDPSNGHGGYSFLKMPVKTYNENNKSIKEEIDNLKKANNNLVKTVTGTDADLRKLSKEDIKLKLIQLGIEDDYINKLSRWERVSVLRYKSTQVASIGYEGDMRKYARGTRMSSKVQREAYQNLINETFKKQIRFITSDAPEEELIDDDIEEQINNSNLNKQSTYYEECPVNEEKRYISSNKNEMVKKSKKKSKGRNNNDPNKKNDDKIIKLYRKNNSQNNVNPNQNFSEGEASVAGNTKIKFDINSLNIDVKYLKKKTNMDAMFEYEDKTTHFGSRKRRDTTDRQLNEIFEDIVDSCIKIDQTKLFHKPVKKKEYPDYYDIINDPIDLYEMKNKTKRSEYKNRHQFMDDLTLLVKNCEIYNGDSHEVTNQAHKINEHAIEKLEISKEKIETYEKQLSSMPIVI